MADRVYPSAKPATNGTTAAPAPAPAPSVGGNPSFPATKAQQYNHARPAYRPQPRRSRRSCCCRCCLWTTFALLLLLLLAAITACIFWVLYRPHRPSFSVSSLQISQFNISSSNNLSSKFNLTVVARNPNHKIIFFYDPIDVSIKSDDVDVGDGQFAGFTHGKKNTTTLRSIISTSAQSVDGTNLPSNLKSKSGLALKIQLDTKVKVKIGGMKTKKVRVRVKCDGIKATVPTGKTATTATTSTAKCKVDLRFKIWRWTI